MTVTEFRRLLDDATEDELALALLRSTQEDAPDPKSLLGAAAALGVGAAFASAVTTPTQALAALGAGAKTAAITAAPSGAGAAAAAPVASASMFALLAKPLAIGVVAGIAAMSGLSYVTDDIGPSAPAVAAGDGRTVSPPPHPAVRAATPALEESVTEETPEHASEETRAAEPSRNAAPVRAVPRVEAPPRREAEVSTNAVNTPPVAQPTAVFNVEPAAPAVNAAPRSVREPAPASELTRQLAREVALLDRARDALGAKDAPAALRALDEYSSERRSGNFDPEAIVLRVRALVSLGDRAAAARLAKSFIAKYPDSRHTAWLRSLTQ